MNIQQLESTAMELVTQGKGILAAEKPDAIVVMLGLHDRTAIREAAADKSKKESDKKDPRAKTDAKTDPKTDAKTDAKPGDDRQPW